MIDWPEARRFGDPHRTRNDRIQSKGGNALERLQPLVSTPIEHRQKHRRHVKLWIEFAPNPLNRAPQLAQYPFEFE